MTGPADDEIGDGGDGGDTVSAPNMPEHIDNGHIDNSVVRAVAEDLRKTNRKTNVVVIAIAGLSGLVVLAAGTGLYKIAQTNKVGVERIVSCTTPGKACYEDQKARSDDLVADVLAKLNEEHLVIECLLQVEPREILRRAELPRCQAEAAAATEKALAQIKAQAEAARREAERKVDGK